MSLKLAGKLLLVGAGNLGGALLRGWVDGGLDGDQIIVQDPAVSDHMAAFMRQHHIQSVNDTAHVETINTSVVVLAIKPQIMDAVIPAVKPFVAPSTVFLSVAAGKTVNYFEAGLGAQAAIIRTIPNTPAAVGRGITAAFANQNASIGQKDQCDNLLQAIGEVVWVEDEALIDAATAVSGSGPAYVFYLTECLSQAGVAAGLPQEIALKLARATVCGAGELMHQSPLGPAALRENVTSPNGTTAAALEVLRENGDFQELMCKAVAAATLRSRELAN